MRDRVPDHRWSEPIAEALKITRRFRHVIADVRFVCGVDPVFAGVHSFTTTADGRGFESTAHCCYPYHLAGPADRRVPTVVLPVPPSVKTVVHELGHRVHWSIGLDFRCKPVSE